MSKYTRDYFIAKFEAIPEDKWCTDLFEDKGRCCALGHCGERGMLDGADTPESRMLAKLFSAIDCHVDSVNDGFNPSYVQPTPRQRILAALRDCPQEVAS